MKLFALVTTLVFSFNIFAAGCPCKADIEKLCPDAKTQDAHKKCLEDNKDKLSKECQEKMPKCLEQKQCPEMEKGKHGKKHCDKKDCKKKDCKKQCPLEKKAEEKVEEKKEEKK